MDGLLIMSNYTLDEVFEECQKFKLKNDMGLTALERAMIGLAFMRGEQRQLEKNITDLEKETT